MLKRNIIPIGVLIVCWSLATALAYATCLLNSHSDLSFMTFMVGSMSMIIFMVGIVYLCTSWSWK